MKELRILIGLPVYRTISVKTAFSLVELLKVTPHDTQVIFQEGVFVHQNQNDIAEYALANGFDYVFYVEHDMLFEPETLNKLLASEKDIICANYNFKSDESNSMVYDEDMELIEEMPKDIFKAGAIPTGLTLIKTEVFKKLAKPYFFFEYDEEGRMKTSQDVYFSLKSKEAGLEVWCNSKIITGHLGDKIY